MLHGRVFVMMAYHISLMFSALTGTQCYFYSLNPSMYYSIAIIVMEKAHIDIHPRKEEVRF